MVNNITEYISYFEAGEDMTDEEYGKYMRAIHISRFAKDIENRFNISNGITLCEDCHKELHKKEGR